MKIKIFSIGYLNSSIYMDATGPQSRRFHSPALPCYFHVHRKLNDYESMTSMSHGKSSKTYFTELRWEKRYYIINISHNFPQAQGR
jgi:hypothetical protein